MKTLGAKIQEVRVSKGISLRALAKRAGISPSFLCDVELGRRYPSDERLEAIADVMGVALSELEQSNEKLPYDRLRYKVLKEPVFGHALRRLVDEDISGEELLAFIKNRSCQERGNIHC